MQLLWEMDTAILDWGEMNMGDYTDGYGNNQDSSGPVITIPEYGVVPAQVRCGKCGRTAEIRKKYYDQVGGGHTVFWIVCPKCGEIVRLSD